MGEVIKVIENDLEPLPYGIPGDYGTLSVEPGTKGAI